MWNYFAEEKIRQRNQFSFGSSVAATMAKRPEEESFFWTVKLLIG
jgi:alpha/beta superfamily hydrolase